MKLKLLGALLSVACIAPMAIAGLPLRSGQFRDVSAAEAALVYGGGCNGGGNATDYCGSCYHAIWLYGTYSGPSVNGGGDFTATRPNCPCGANTTQDIACGTCTPY